MNPRKTKISVGDKAYSMDCKIGKTIINNPKNSPVENKITLANLGGSVTF